MGHSRYNAADWADFAGSTRGRSRDELFGRRSLDPDLDPARFARRESRDSDLNPHATPIILASDVTGSMGFLAEVLVRDGIGRCFDRLLAGGAVRDPHVLAMAVGDAACDAAPLQATQFEADPVTLAAQMQRLFLEGGGGGNDKESYDLPWVFAAGQTATDAWERRRAKGFLFTFGDEPPPRATLGAEVQRTFGGRVRFPARCQPQETLALAEQRWEVFHVVITEGSGVRTYPDTTRRWKALLGERALVLDDHTKLAELVVSTIELLAGQGADTVYGRWDRKTAAIVAAATRGLLASRPAGGDRT